MNPRAVKLAERRDAIKAQLESYDNTVIERGTDLEGTEKANYDQLTDELGKVVGDIEEISKREQLIARSFEAGLAAGVEVKIPAQAKRADNPELIYRAGGEHNPLADLVAMARGDSEAASRVFTHNQVNADKFRIDRASTTSSLGGLVVPEYLTNAVVPYVREGRPFADVVRHENLNAYTTTIPRVTTPAAMAPVDGQNTTYTSANYATTGLDITAKTIGGYVDISVEAITFGSLPVQAIFADLAADYNRQVERQIFNGTDANGQVEGIFVSDGLGSVTASSATSGAAELWAKVTEAASQVHVGIEMEATYLVMSSTRWYKLLSELGTDDRPLLGVREGNPSNVQGNADPARGRTFANLPVILSNAIYGGVTSADTKVVVCKADELWLLEQNGGTPVAITADQLGAKTGTITLAARGFVAFTAERQPAATTVITGLPVPTF
jgi:HK97 family phage major capsid protein